MRLKITALLLVALALVSFRIGKVPAEVPEKGTTVMIYMCGSDLEAKHFQGTNTIKEINKAGINREKVNVVALLGGTTVWGPGYDASKLTLVELGGRRATEADSFDGRSMGEPETLTAFLDLCHERYPAQRYILIVWDHGGGPNGGVCFDLLYNDDSLSVGELSSALEKSTFANKGLDIIAFNTCLTGSIEFAANLAPYASYMIATEDSMYGLAYTNWLKVLDTDATPLDTAKNIVDETYAFNKETIEAQNALEMNSVALIDLDKVAPVVQAMDAFFANVTPTLNVEGFARTAQCRRDSLTFGSTESNGYRNYDLADLGDLTLHLKEYEPDSAAQLLSALNDAVVYLRTDEETSTGLTVYHPYSNKDDLTKLMAAHNDIQLSASYSGYIQQYAAMMTGTPLADWTDLHTEQNANKDMRTLFSLQLSEEQASNLASSRFRVLRKAEDGSMAQIFDSPETYSSDRNISGQYNGIALYAVSDDQAVSPAIPYETGAKGTILIKAHFVRAGMEDLPDMEADGLLSCNQDGDQLTPGGVMIYDEATGSYTSAYGMIFNDFTEISIPVVRRQEKRNEKGTLLPFDEWETVSEEVWSSPVNDSWSFRFLHETIPTEDLYAAFEVTDVQYYRYTSDPARVAPEKKAGLSGDAIWVQYDDLNLALINQFSLSEGNNTLTLTAHVTNLLPEQEALIRLEALTINGTAVATEATVYGTGENWGLLPLETQFLTAAIPDAPKLEEISDLTFQLNLLDAADETVSLGIVPVTVTISQNP